MENTLQVDEEFKMENFKDEELEIDVKMGDPVMVRWIGVSQFREPNKNIDSFFEKLAQESGSSKTIVVDFLGLNYMNSTAVVNIINLCKIFDEHDVPTHLIYDRTSGWQTASFKALESISQILKQLTVEGKQPH